MTRPLPTPHVDRVTCWLRGRADGYRADARYREAHPPGDKGGLSTSERRAVADELEQIAIDFERSQL